MTPPRNFRTLASRVEVYADCARLDVDKALLARTLWATAHVGLLKLPLAYAMGWAPVGVSFGLDK